MKTVAKSGLKVRSAVKAGGLMNNHIRAGLRIRSAIKAGGLMNNHSRGGLRVQSGVRGGKHELLANHSRVLLAPAR